MDSLQAIGLDGGTKLRIAEPILTPRKGVSIDLDLDPQKVSPKGELGIRREIFGNRMTMPKTGSSEGASTATLSQHCH